MDAVVKELTFSNIRHSYAKIKETNVYAQQCNFRKKIARKNFD